MAALAIGGLAFGLIRGQAQAWSDIAAWIAIAVGVISLVLFPILMATRPNPLVPLGLFRSRAFATVNLATFFVYGALYVTFGYQPLVLQGVLGYTALGAGLIGLPSGVMLSVLSTRVGTVAARVGPRRFLVIGPLLMAGGLLWFARLPADSEPWLASVETPATLVPPLDAVIDVLPAILLFGVGISLVVAPLTSTLMGSIPGRFSGIGSAINNAISRVGQPLLGAIIFIAISATFYTALGTYAPGLDTDSTEVRNEFQPLNPPPEGATPAEALAANQASMEAFHLAILVCAGLLVIGTLVFWFGLRERPAPGGAEAGAPAAPEAAELANPERLPVAWDDDVGGRQDARAAPLEVGLVRRERVDLGRSIRMPPQVGHRVDRIVRLHDERDVLLGVAGRQPELDAGRQAVAIAVMVEPQVVDVARPEVDHLRAREERDVHRVIGMMVRQRDVGHRFRGDAQPVEGVEDQ